MDIKKYLVTDRNDTIVNENEYVVFVKNYTSDYHTIPEKSKAKVIWQNYRFRLLGDSFLLDMKDEIKSIIEKE